MSLKLLELISIIVVILSFSFFYDDERQNDKSLVCVTGDVPPNAIQRDDGWKGFRIQGILDFSLIGILAGIAALLAENGISIFAISTYNTDYVLVKKESYPRAMDILGRAGYEIVE